MDPVAKPTILDLDPGAQGAFGRRVFRAMERYPTLSFEECYLVMLDLWGLSCHHPPTMRRPVVGRSGRARPDVFECAVCKSWVLSLEE